MCVGMSWQTYSEFTKVSRVGWWMGLFGAPTAKRQFAYSNSPVARRLDRGKLQVQPRKASAKRNAVKKNKQKKIATAVQYRNKQGKLCWHGTGELKATETLDFKSFYS